ncbi:hypothetical protein [Streptomyces sp. YIM S03343]
MSFHKIAPVKKHRRTVAAPAPKPVVEKAAAKKPVPAPKRRPVGQQG